MGFGNLGRISLVQERIQNFSGGGVVLVLLALYFASTGLRVMKPIFIRKNSYTLDYNLLLWEFGYFWYGAFYFKMPETGTQNWNPKLNILLLKCFRLTVNLESTTIENASKTRNVEWKHVQYKKASERWDEVQMVFERDFRFSYHLIGDPSCWRGQRLPVTSPPSYGTGTFFHYYPLSFFLTCSSLSYFFILQTIVSQLCAARTS